MAKDCEERGEDEHRQDSIEKCGAAHRDGDSVDGDEETGDGGRGNRVEQVTSNHHDEQDDEQEDPARDGPQDPGRLMLGQCGAPEEDEAQGAEERDPTIGEPMLADIDAGQYAADEDEGHPGKGFEDHGSTVRRSIAVVDQSGDSCG